MAWRILKITVPFLCVAAVLVSASACDSDMSGIADRTGSQDSPQQDSPTDVVPADDLPPPDEPWLADPGDWAADFNDAQISCYRGSMSACDSIWLDERVLSDTWLYEYGYLCGNRIRAEDGGSAIVARRRAYGTADCVEIFPGHD